MFLVEQENIAILDKRAQIQTRIADFRALLQRVDWKTRLLLIALNELQVLSGVNIDCFADAENEVILSKADDFIENIKNTPGLLDESDAQMLFELYQAASEINRKG